MANIRDLPCEIIVQILENLGNVKAICPARLVCRHFNASFRENKTRVLRSVLQAEIDDELLPYAISLVLEKPEINSPDLTNSIQTIYDNPNDIRNQLYQIQSDKIYSISRTHEAIGAFVTEFSKSAWISALGTPFRPASSIPEASVSSTEHVRIFRAFYRVELFLSIYGHSLPGASPQAPRLDGPVWFYAQHNPWECHQILAVYEFLDDAVRSVSSRLANSSISSEGAALFHQVSIAEGMRRIRYIRRKFPSAASNHEMAATFNGMVEEPWLDPFAPRHNCDLSGYSDHNDSLMTSLPRSNPEYFYRDKSIKENWAGAYRYRQGIPDEQEMGFLRKAGFVFWDAPSEERRLCPMTSIFLLLATQAEESDGSEFDYDEDISDYEE